MGVSLTCLTSVSVSRLGAQPPSVIDVPQRIRGMKPIGSGMQPSGGPIQQSDSSQTEGQQASSDSSGFPAASDGGSRQHGGDKDLVWIIDPKTGKEKGVTPDQLRQQVSSPSSQLLRFKPGYRAFSNDTPVLSWPRTCYMGTDR